MTDKVKIVQITPETTFQYETVLMSDGTVWSFDRGRWTRLEYYDELTELANKTEEKS